MAPLYQGESCKGTERRNVLRLSRQMLRRLLRTGKLDVCVVGAGYVGSSLIAGLAKAGASVIATDIDDIVVENINRGVPPVRNLGLEKAYKEYVRKGRIRATTDVSKAVEQSPIVSISVPTPTNAKNRPNLANVRDACKRIGHGLTEGTLVIVESTVTIGTTRNVVTPLLEKYSRLQAAKSFGVAHAPERIDPGNRLVKFDKIPRIVSGIDEASLRVATEYLGLISPRVVPVSSLEAAEAVKLVENTYRDLNVAFSNELALFFEPRGIDTFEVLRACATKWSFQLHLPGAGVGGHCIPVSPRYLLAIAKPEELKLARFARNINDGMPLHLLDLVRRALKKADRDPRTAKVAIMGVAYKANVGDVRSSPAIKIITALKDWGAKVVACDPYVGSEKMKSLFGIPNSRFKQAVRGADCVVIVTDHDVFRKIPLTTYKRLASNPVVLVDGRGMYDPGEADRIGIIYAGIGRSAITH